MDNYFSGARLGSAQSMTSGERVELARYKVKHTVPIRRYRDPDSLFSLKIGRKKSSFLNFETLSAILERNRSVDLERVVQEIASGTGTTYSKYKDKFVIPNTSKSVSSKVSVSRQTSITIHLSAESAKYLD